MSSGQPQFSCNACGKTFVWKPQLAGKKGTCKCGNIFQVPIEPEAPVAQIAQCPRCGAELVEGAVLCVQCGYNLQTGAAIATQIEQEPTPVAAVAAAAPAAAASARAPARGPFIPPERRRQQAAAESSSKKPLILGGIGLLLVIGIIVGARFYIKGSGKPAGPSLGRDAEAEEMLRSQFPREANEFLDSNPGVMLGNQWTTAVAKMKIKNWYDMGAKKVWAFGAGASVVLELPQDPESRKKLFDWTAQWDKDHMLKVQKDVGQKYLIVNLMAGFSR